MSLIKNDFNRVSATRTTESLRLILHIFDETTSTEKEDISSLTFADANYAERIQKIKGVEAFINRLKEKSASEGFPEFTIVSYTEIIWLDILNQYNDVLPVPLLSLGAAGGILFTFRKEEHYLELEVVHSGIEFYYENEATGKSDFKEFDFGTSVIESIEKWLLKFVYTDAGIV